MRIGVGNSEIFDKRGFVQYTDSVIIKISMSLIEHTTEVFRLPRRLRNYWRTKKMAEQKITEAVVLSLFQEEKITVSKGAELLGIPIQDFMDLLNQSKLPLDEITPEEMAEDRKILQKLGKKYKKAQTV